ncbi:hypothetical protein HK097_003657 [Rhizophlyctis rosea]|uniref:Pectate lyase n=1 Tax=Rhizophlyctis rosea TaxID=64517 RepID=A0AAD5X3S4_9FUNG|nr:hypothetical protein HK097_003657 [Rhizophlyctis rosea]
MHFIRATIILAALSALPSALGAAVTTFPSAKGSVSNGSAITVKAGQTYDGGMKRFDRGNGACSSGEGGQKDAVFILEKGATLKNAIIGKNQKEGVHCNNGCKIQNVWWEDVCEDALTVLGSGGATITGGGAKSASDKVIQHNGSGTVTITDFFVDGFGKLYRSCGNCKTQFKRSVVIQGVVAKNGKELVGINQKYGDTVSISRVSLSGVSAKCSVYDGNNSGAEPKRVGTC